VRRFLLVLALLGLVLATAQTSTGGRFALRGVVTHVVDGDTLDVRIDGRGIERVRLIGLDTPEVGACGASAATAAARRLADGRAVVLRGDVTQATRDRYGRLLAYVWLPGGRDLGFRLLAGGHARVYVYDRAFERLTAYRRAEELGRPHRAQCAAPAPRAAGCDPSYPDVCIPPPPPDLDCADVPHTGFRVVGADPHRFDGDGDGVGCEG
jgi:micrococcal nuclease